MYPTEPTDSNTTAIIITIDVTSEESSSAFTVSTLESSFFSWL